jgi:Flp pilus assembly protein TadD
MNHSKSDRDTKADLEGALPGKLWWVLGAVCAVVIGLFAWSARSGLLEARASRAGDTYYNLLVQALRSGQLNLKTEVPPGLAQLADPYDPIANSDFRLADRYPLHDLSYYRGKLYLYFGITPALLLFWPYAALTGQYLLHKDAVVIFCAVGFLASAGLLWAVWRRYFAEIGIGVVAAGTLGLGLASFMPLILPRCDVYEVSISCGYALTMLALGGIWRAVHDPGRRGRWLVVASLAYGLAIGARPSLLLGGVILLVPVIQAWRETAEPGSQRPLWALLLAATGPLLLVVFGLLLYNAARFGNPLEFGQRYLLAAYREDKVKHFSLSYLWYNLRLYFLEPARWSGGFPFAHDAAVPPVPAGHGGVDHPFGLLTNIPVVWLALAVPLAWRRQSEEARSTLRWFLAALALLVGASTLTIGLYYAVCLRYQGDFAPELVLLAAIGILAADASLTGRLAWRRATRCCWGLLLTFSVLFNLLASFDRLAETEAGLGNLHLDAGQIEQAIIHFQRALKYSPENASTHSDLGIALFRMGQVDEAIVQFQKAVALQPEAPEGHSNLGNALVRKGQMEEAIIELRKAVKIQSSDAVVQNTLASLLLRQRRADEAMDHFRKAVQIDPKLASAHSSLANLLLQRGQLDEAITHYQAAIEAQPANPYYLNNLAWVLATSPQAAVRNGARAVELAQEAERLSGGKNPSILGTLAAAYAEAGRLAQAVATAQRALELATAQTNIAELNPLRAQSELYRAGSPFRDTSRTNDTPYPR